MSDQRLSSSNNPDPDDVYSQGPTPWTEDTTYPENLPATHQEPQPHQLYDEQDSHNTTIQQRDAEEHRTDEDSHYTSTSPPILAAAQEDSALVKALNHEMSKAATLHGKQPDVTDLYIIATICRRHEWLQEHPPRLHSKNNHNQDIPKTPEGGTPRQHPSWYAPCSTHQTWTILRRSLGTIKLQWLTLTGNTPCSTKFSNSKTKMHGNWCTDLGMRKYFRASGNLK